MLVAVARERSNDESNKATLICVLGYVRGSGQIKVKCILMG